MECPYCKEEIKDGAIKCKHCGSMLDESPTQSNIQKDKVFYREGNILVTNSRFIVGTTTYSIPNISSVKIDSHIDQNHIAVSIYKGIIDVIIALIIFSAIFYSTVSSMGSIGYVVGIIPVVLYFILRKPAKQPETIYTIKIESNSGSSNVLRDTNKETIVEIVTAINDAIEYQNS